MERSGGADRQTLSRPTSRALYRNGSGTAAWAPITSGATHKFLTRAEIDPGEFETRPYSLHGRPPVSLLNLRAKYSPTVKQN